MFVFTEKNNTAYESLLLGQSVRSFSELLRRVVMVMMVVMVVLMVMMVFVSLRKGHKTPRRNSWPGL